MRRITWRTSSSTVEVTVHVLRTTRSASAMALDRRPCAVRHASMAAPSAWEARHPKVLTKKLCKIPLSLAANATLARANEIDQVACVIGGHFRLDLPERIGELETAAVQNAIRAFE